MGMTMAEKILAAHSDRREVRAGEYVTARVDYACMKYSYMDIWSGMEEAGIPWEKFQIWDRDRVVVVNDYDGPAPDKNVKTAERQKTAREFAERLALPHFYDVSAGICHQVIMDEGFIVPGDLVVVTDSHTPIYGSLGCAGTGIGEAEMAWVLNRGTLWFLVPETIKIIVSGRLADGVMAKDIYLAVSGEYGTDFAQYKALEWYGEAIEALSLDGRMCIANQAVELGAKFCLFQADEKVERFLHGRARRAYKPVVPDPDARYERVLELDGSRLSPLVAQPHDMSVVKPAAEYRNIRIHQASIGGCASGRLEDLEAAARILKGRRVQRGVRCIVGAADQETFAEAIRAGYIGALAEAGVTVCHPHCGPCTGGIGALADGEVCITSTSRNFKGRMGSTEAEIYMGSPATVAASALTGYITDPREVM